MKSLLLKHGKDEILRVICSYSKKGCFEKSGKHFILKPMQSKKLYKALPYYFVCKIVEINDVCKIEYRLAPKFSTVLLFVFASATFFNVLYNFITQRPVDLKYLIISVILNIVLLLINSIAKKQYLQEFKRIFQGLSGTGDAVSQNNG